MLSLCFLHGVPRASGVGDPRPGLAVEGEEFFEAFPFAEAIEEHLPDEDDLPSVLIEGCRDDASVWTRHVLDERADWHAESCHKASVRSCLSISCCAIMFYVAR